jgi:hypothetical protein
MGCGPVTRRVKPSHLPPRSVSVACPLAGLNGNPLLCEAVHIRISRFELLGTDPFGEGLNWLVPTRQCDNLLLAN